MFLPVVDVDVLCIMRSYVDIRPYDLFNRLFSTFDVEEKKAAVEWLGLVAVFVVFGLSRQIYRMSLKAAHQLYFPCPCRTPFPVIPPFEAL